jgi:hypothetical protein
VRGNTQNSCCRRGISAAERLTQGELENHGFRLAGKFEINIQANRIAFGGKFRADIAGFRFNLARAFSEVREHCISRMTIGKDARPACGAVGIIHHGADINTAAGGRFVGTTFINGISHYFSPDDNSTQSDHFLPQSVRLTGFHIHDQAAK